jgi:hypothetical protein
MEGRAPPRRHAPPEGSARRRLICCARQVVADALNALAAPVGWVASRRESSTAVAELAWPVRRCSRHYPRPADRAACDALGVLGPEVAIAGRLVKCSGQFTCGTDPGDVPGVPPIGFRNSTVVVTPNGGVNVTCTGPVPAGLVSRTFVGTAPCVGDGAWWSPATSSSPRAVMQPSPATSPLRELTRRIAPPA